MGQGMGAPSLFETLRGYLKAGWEVHYLTAAKRVLGGGSHEENIPVDLEGVVVHRFALPAPIRALGARVQGKADRLYLFPKYAALSFRNIFEQVRPDLVYAYEEGGIQAVVRARRAHEIQVPVLHRFQGTILGDRYSHWPTVLRKAESWRALRARGDLYVMTDDGTRGDRALRHWNRHVDDENMLFIRNGIDTGMFRADADRAEVLRSVGLGPDCFMILMVSRLAGWKRVDRGIALVAALRARHPHVRLVIAGDGEDRGMLESYCRDKGVSDVVIFMGAKARAQVALMMSVADLFLSLYDISNCGNPLYEAMLCGRPIITLNNGGTKDVIANGVNGLLVEPNDNDALVAVAANLVRNIDLSVRLGNGARQWAHENLKTWQERMTQETNWVSSRLIHGRSV